MIDPNEFDPDDAAIEPSIEERANIGGTLSRSGEVERPVLTVDATSLAELGENAVEAVRDLPVGEWVAFNEHFGGDTEVYRLAELMLVDTKTEDGTVFVQREYPTIVAVV
jgi:hypothetical protein